MAQKWARKLLTYIQKKKRHQEKENQKKLFVFLKSFLTLYWTDMWSEQCKKPGVKLEWTEYNVGEGVSENIT